MHDLHTADKLLKLALKYAKMNKIKKIKSIVIELGTVVEHGEEINPDNLKFNFNLLSKGTPAQDAKVVIGKIKGESWNLKEIEGE